MNAVQWSLIPALLSTLPLFCSAATLDVAKENLTCSDVTGTPYCSISAAIAAAVNGDDINVGPGTYNENLSILKSISISGSDAETTIVDGGGLSRTIFIQGDVVISGVTVQNGYTSTGLGGGIWINGGSLILTDAIVINNQADGGGGIGTSAPLTLLRSVVSDNTSTNSLGSASGGGVYISFSAADTQIIASTISNNTSDYSAGGILNLGSSTAIVNSTISGNATDVFGGGLANGGGSSSNVTLSNVTVSGNTAVAGGGVVNTNGVVRLSNTIVAGNSDLGSAPDCGEQTIHSDGYNLIGSTVGCSFVPATGDILDQGAAGLGPLTDNGGGSPTHALLPGSRAIESGNPAGCREENNLLLSTDQTGESRTVDGDVDGIPVCDIGAYGFRHGLVADTGGSPLITSETMGMATFNVVLVSPPASDVTVPVASSDLSEGEVTSGSLTFTPANWDQPQQVVVTGVDDSQLDGDVGYTVSVGPTVSLDPDYDNISLPALSVTNTDDDTAPEADESGGGGAVDLLILLGIGLLGLWFQFESKRSKSRQAV